jgi:quinolinate synthase
MMHKLRTLNPGKTFIEAPTAGNSATCKSCAHCPWMAMNGLAGVAHVLETGSNAIHVDPALGSFARPPARLTACWPSPPRSKEFLMIFVRTPHTAPEFDP